MTNACFSITVLIGVTFDTLIITLNIYVVRKCVIIKKYIYSSCAANEENENVILLICLQIKLYYNVPQKLTFLIPIFIISFFLVYGVSTAGEMVSEVNDVIQNAL